ncbi:MAG TPA: cupin domain-containing protein, partial [Steroidobacteraceae bacterium]|nr:cupin domain-containing protein [Steroidobacteraceae bacterium]
LPALITFPVLSGIQDVMGFRLDNSSGIDQRSRTPRRDMRMDAPFMVCSGGLWEAAVSEWKLRTHEREYCRIVHGRIRVQDCRQRQWEFTTGSAFLLLRGFEGTLEVLEPVQIVYMVFSMPEGSALDWCMVSEGRTALGQERLLV